MHQLRVDTYLTNRTANILKEHGFDVSRPNRMLASLVNTRAWQDIDDFGSKRRDELSQALISVQKHAPLGVASAIQLLESHGYTVTPPPK